MLDSREINRIILAVREFGDLLEKMSLVVDRLRATREEWNVLLAGRDRLREESGRLAREIAGFKEDFQVLHIRETRWRNAVGDLNLDLPFLVDEFRTILSRHGKSPV